MADVLLKQPNPLQDIDDAKLEAMLDAFDPSNPTAPLEIPGEEPQPVEPPAAEEPPPPAEEPPAETPPVEPEIDLAASEREGEKIARREMEAKIAMLEAHNSRLAGKLGFVEQKLKSVPQASEPYEPQSQAEIDRLTSLEQRLEHAEQRRLQSEVSQVIGQTYASLDGPWSTELAEEIKVIGPKYADHIKMAQETTDPELARALTTAVVLRVQTEAEKMRWEKNHQGLVERKASTAPAALAAKKAAAVSGSGAVPAPAPKPKTFADMTAEEADAWLRENVR